jgi:hypothetical protein
MGVKLLCICMHVFGLEPAIDVPFPQGCFSVHDCIWVVSMVSIWSEDPVQLVSICS